MHIFVNVHQASPLWYVTFSKWYFNKVINNNKNNVKDFSITSSKSNILWFYEILNYFFPSFFKFYFIFKLYKIVLVMPNIIMNLHSFSCLCFCTVPCFICFLVSTNYSHAWQFPKLSMNNLTHSNAFKISITSLSTSA